MKKSFVLLALLFSIIFTLAGCSNDSNQPVQNEVNSSSKTPAQSPQKSSSQVKEKNCVVVTDSGYSQGKDGFLKFGFIIENTSEKTTFQFHKVIITAYDAENKVLATQTQVMNVIKPGEKQAFGSILNCNGETPSRVDFTPEDGESTNILKDVIPSSELKAQGLNDRKDEYSVSITGTIKNDSNADADHLGVTVLLRSNGKIVLGETTYVENIASGSEKPFQLSIYDYPEYDSYEVHAFDWSF